jgi:hypothetical protein
MEYSPRPKAEWTFSYRMDSSQRIPGNPLTSSCWMSSSAQGSRATTGDTSRTAVFPLHYYPHKIPPIMAPPNSEVRVYKGSCHCAATKFSVKAPTITDASSCNCSICTKNGSLFIYPTDKYFVFEFQGPLTEYRFGQKTFGHKVSWPEPASKLCLPSSPPT